MERERPSPARGRGEGVREARVLEERSYPVSREHNQTVHFNCLASAPPKARHGGQIGEKGLFSNVASAINPAGFIEPRLPGFSILRKVLRTTSRICG